jgi:hypothetical protein
MREEEDALAIRRPANGDVRVGMIGQAARLAAGGGDDVDVRILVVCSSESDEGAVRL